MRVLLVLMVIAIVASIGLASVFSGQGVLTVSETISVTAPESFDVDLEPNITVVKTLVIHNSGDADTTVLLIIQVKDDLSGPYLNVLVETPLNPLLIPANDSLIVDYSVVALNGVAVGIGTVEVDVLRPDVP